MSSRQTSVSQLQKRAPLKNGKWGRITMEHQRAFKQSLSHFFMTPIASLLTLIVIALALALPASLYMLTSNAERISRNVDSDTQITVYLTPSISKHALQQLLIALPSRSDIKKVTYISPEEGLSELKDQPGFDNILPILTENPLPGVLLIEPVWKTSKAEEQEQLLYSLKSLADVEDAQWDLAWLSRLQAMLAFGKRLLFWLYALLGTGVLLIIVNTIHLSMQKFHDEITIIKLVGATNKFVRRPFVYSGILLGLLGSLLATVLTSIAHWWLQPSITRISNLYNMTIELQALPLSASISLIAFGTLLGIIGSWLAVSHHLRQQK